MRSKYLLEKILKDFEKIVRHEDAERLGKKVWRMFQQYHLEQLGAGSASKVVKEKIITEMTNTALAWDTNDASLSSIQKMFNRLASGRYADAVKLAESAKILKELVDKTAITKNATNAVNKKHASNNATIKKAMAWYLEHQSKYEGRGGQKNAAIDLEEKFPPIKKSTYASHLKKLR